MTEKILEGSELDLSEIYEVGNNVIESISNIEKNTTNLVELLTPVEEELIQEDVDTEVLGLMESLDQEEEVPEEEVEVVQSSEELLLIDLNESLTLNNELLVSQNELLEQSVKAEWSGIIIIGFVILLGFAVTVFVKEISKW